MILIITKTQAEKLLSGDYTFSQLGFSMLITRLKGNYAKDSSQGSLQKCVDEINFFLSKYSAIITSDISIIAKL